LKKALITGGAGFIGCFLAERLLDLGWQVDLVDNLSRGRMDAFLQGLLRKPGASFIECDLLDGKQSLALLGRDYTHIFHFAAILGVQNVIDNPDRTLYANVMLLKTALDLAKAQDRLSRFVFASTSEVYAGSLETIGLTIPTPENHVITLPDLGRPRTSYMLSKLYGESMVRLSGLPHTIIRPHNVYGPRMGLSHVVPQLLQKAHEAVDGASIEVFSVDHMRTFCFITDAINMILLAAELPECLDQVLNLGTEAPEYQIEQLAEVVIKVVDKTLAIQPGPETQGSPSRRAPDMTKMAQLTGYVSKVELMDGVRLTYQWYSAKVFVGERTNVAI
jgi:UDP-glucose 4-epimerase